MRADFCLKDKVDEAFVCVLNEVNFFNFDNAVNILYEICDEFDSFSEADSREDLYLKFNLFVINDIEIFFLSLIKNIKLVLDKKRIYSLALPIQKKYKRFKTTLIKIDKDMSRQIVYEAIMRKILYAVEKFRRRFKRFLPQTVRELRYLIRGLKSRIQCFNFTDNDYEVQERKLKNEFDDMIKLNTYVFSKTARERLIVTIKEQKTLFEKMARLILFRLDLFKRMKRVKLKREWNSAEFFYLWIQDIINEFFNKYFFLEKRDCVNLPRLVFPGSFSND